MIHQITLTVALTDPVSAQAAYDALKQALSEIPAKALASPLTHQTRITLHTCTHDQPHPEPCTISQLYTPPAQPAL